jgi:hypothetical protein
MPHSKTNPTAQSLVAFYDNAHTHNTPNHQHHHHKHDTTPFFTFFVLGTISTATFSPKK